jgi:hypothetical protein
VTLGSLELLHRFQAAVHAEHSDWHPTFFLLVNHFPSKLFVRFRLFRLLELHRKRKVIAVLPSLPLFVSI